MICPYICHVDQIQQTLYTRDEDGAETMSTVVLHEAKIPMTCAKEDCGAWHDGRCAYAHAEA